MEGPAESQRAREDQPQNERHPVFMTDEEFDALPCWSDVEDDPEYNTIYRPRRAASHTEVLPRQTNFSPGVLVSDSLRSSPTLRFGRYDALDSGSSTTLTNATIRESPNLPPNWPHSPSGPSQAPRYEGSFNDILDAISQISSEHYSSSGAAESQSSGQGPLQGDAPILRFVGKLNSASFCDLLDARKYPQITHAQGPQSQAGSIEDASSTTSTDDSQ